MKVIDGNCNEARIHTDIIEETVVVQIKEMCDLQELEGSKIEIMPDCHSGKGCVIGTTIRQKISRPINPAYVGVDLGCGVSAVEFKIDDVNELELCKFVDKTIREFIPFGTDVRNEFVLDENYFDELICKDSLPDFAITRARKSLGTLGRGNHYIEIDKLENGRYILVVHSGSRNLGKCVAEYYMSKGNENKFLLEEQDILDYLKDALFCQRYALQNREMILKTIREQLRENFAGFELIDEYSSVHNTIEANEFDEEEIIIRKGAIPAYDNQITLIPINMRDGIIIGVGKGNEDTNYSAPHGAGRLMGRGQAKRELSVEEFEEQMKDIYSTCVSKETLDEAPNAYKPIESIIENISDMVEIKEIAKPIYNFKA